MTVRERWRALPRFGRGILAALALMAVGFGAAMLVFQTRLSPLCEPGGQLVPRREGEVLRYSGRTVWRSTAGRSWTTAPMSWSGGRAARPTPAPTRAPAPGG